ncbi:tethering factor for nuclear proteasome STS1 [Favolaschia claudopus]|uniref:Tethering factor for nuclear proteasome STS1 n=1 Tax=Favolaschia claudopus TaxID=2862362 RepID=A0AAW0EHR2_9AGAR
MDRSPTPERPKRAAPKRARVSPSAESGSKDEKVSKENKAPGATEENDVDVGVLLASLPSQSLLPLLTSLLSAQPSLKSLILPLIPRPTLETALQVLSQSSKKLRDAYPYENSAQPTPVTLGFGFGASRHSFGAFGRPQAPPSQAAFSQNPSNVNSGMRESYVTSRIRTHVTEFVSACMSYMPYFSYAPGTAQSSSATQSHSTTLQSLHRGHHHPNETYQYLAAIMDHFLSQPPLTQASLGPQLLPRLEEEWKAWVNKLDESVNGQAGMFTEDVVRTWERGLDGYANSQGDAGRVMRMVRDLWISKVGWLAEWARHRVYSAVVIPRFGPSFTRQKHLRAHLSFTASVRDNFSSRGTSQYHYPPRPPRNSHDSASSVSENFDDSMHLDQARSAARKIQTVERANSRKSLYNNLLRLLSSRRNASLPVLLDYHELHHGLRSVHSYNLLIALAIRRHVVSGMIQFLFKAMDNDEIPGNRETEKLKVRWSVRTGNWDDAWLQVTAAHPNSMPLPLWLEFFHGAKVRRIPIPRRANALPSHGLSEARFQTLMQNLPTFLPNQVPGSVRAAHIVVRSMLSLDRPQSALTFAMWYFNGLPQYIDAPWAEKCVAVIDALIAFEAKKRGLRDFYAARRKLNSLLEIHPTFRPTAKTLYLLLGTLSHAKQRGTVSWQTLIKFKMRWGPQVEDSRVRRRVGSYAAERLSRLQLRASGPTEQSQLAHHSMRTPFRVMFPRHGYEERLWKSLSIRALKVKLRWQHAPRGGGIRVISK